MRKWCKYLRNPLLDGKKYLKIDDNFKMHAKAMGGYESDEAYESKERFFDKYYYNFHTGRLKLYDVFIRKLHLKKEGMILSLASGRCANELFLGLDGYQITCSDLDFLPSYSSTLKLFPEFKFEKFNILHGPTKKKYDNIICLSLIYLFDQKDLERFFLNVSESLKEEGNLILDYAGSPDNFLSYLIHDVLLKYETCGIMIANNLRGKKERVRVKHHGFRRTDREVISAAEKYGFQLINQENFAFSTEFKRSVFINKLLQSIPVIEKLLTIFGGKIPYIRMGNFAKDGGGKKSQK